MKRFSFPLERVRQWRNMQVEVEHSKLRQLFDEMRRLELASERLAAAVAEAEFAVQEAASTRQAVDGQQLADLDDYRLYSKREEQRLAAQREQLQGRIAEQRGRLVEARRNFRLLEKLKQSRLEEWERDYHREVESLASELHLARWNREQPESRRP